MTGCFETLFSSLHALAEIRWQLHILIPTDSLSNSALLVLTLTVLLCMHKNRHTLINHHLKSMLQEIDYSS